MHASRLVYMAIGYATFEVTYYQLELTEEQKVPAA